MKRNEAQLQFDTLAIEGGLFTAEWLSKVASFKAPSQTDTDYAVRAGFSTREEIALAWRSAQHLWGQFKSARQPSGADTWAVTQRFVTELLRQSFGFTNLRAAEQPQELDGRHYPVGHFAVGHTVPLIISACTEPKLLDTPHDRLGDSSGDRLRRRSAFGLLQEFLNAADHALWGIASNGLLLRIARDNGSLTRPAWLEADLERLFEEENQAEFSVLWLLLHASRFGAEGQPPNDCILEQWRNGCRDQGIQARGLLRRNVEQALKDLGQGFVGHPANAALREALGNGSLSTREYFRQLLRLVYRLIFLLTVEERGILHPPGSLDAARSLFERGYSLKLLRDKAVRRSAHDRHHDLWEGLKRVWLGLAEGEPRLALPALGGLFSSNQCPALDGARLENRHLLAALFHLAWMRDAPGEPLTRVNWRDMGSEELGGIYESLLELTPQLAHDNRHFSFLEGSATKGNARKTSGSYYTPDSLVQELLDSALEPVVAKCLASYGGTLASGEAAAQALLSITVCDPACGSGHFILAAARRLATHLARVQTEGSQPTPDDYRHALRQVVTHCIHGVDLNPMAVELAKIALWLEAYTPDAPLGFIDHHIRCGDALLGILDPAILENGIPDKAFNALSGDDKEVVKALKKANKDALKSIAKIQQEGHMPNWQEAVGQAAELETLPDDTLIAIDAKRAAFAETEAAIAQSRARIAADIFLAAFILPKTPQNKDLIPTSQDLWLVMNGEAPRTGVPEAAAKAVSSVQALHWWQAFPQVRAKGGFDVLLGNPPWDQLVFREQEFFSAVAPSIAQARTSSERTRLISELSENQPALYKLYTDELRKSEALRLLTQEGGQFLLTGRGRSNTFSLFTELCWKLANACGRIGLVVPSGVITDDTTKLLFQDLVKTNSLVSVLDFENRLPLFPDIDSRTKFSLLTMRGIDSHDDNLKPLFVFFAQTPDDVRDPERHLLLAKEDFDLLNPNTRTACVFRTRRDAEITLKVHRETPVLLLEGSSTGNPWQLATRPGLFNMAGHSSIFKSRDELLAQGGRLEGNVFEVKSKKYLPLYEGKMVSLFDHRAADVVISQTAALRQGQSEALTETEHLDPSRSPMPRHWVDESLVYDQVGEEWDRKWIIGWKEITSPTNERTLIPSVLPLVAIGHKFPIFIIGEENRKLAPCFLGNLSSLVCDFIVRQKLGTTSLTPFTIKQLPILPPDRFSKAEIDFICPRILELTYTAHDLQSWASDLNYDGPPFLWNSERRAVLRAELDALYARLYGLTRDELRYILSPTDVMGMDYPSETFRVLKKNEIEQFDEYRTARLVLREFDRMALADATGEAYQSLLVPPPGQQTSPQYSPIGVIRDENEARLTGLVLALIRQAGTLPRQHLTFALEALQNEVQANVSLSPSEAAQLSAYRQSHSVILPGYPNRLQSVLRFFETSGVVGIQQQGALIAAIADAPLPSGVIIEPDVEAIAGILLRVAHAGIERQEAEALGTASRPATKRA